MGFCGHVITYTYEVDDLLLSVFMSVCLYEQRISQEVMDLFEPNLCNGRHCAEDNTNGSRVIFTCSKLLGPMTALGVVVFC